MDETLRLEVSPGTIRIEPCNKCHTDAITFDTVALKDYGEEWGVAWAGTITRCPTCNPSQ